MAVHAAYKVHKETFVRPVLSVAISPQMTPPSVPTEIAEAFAFGCIVWFMARAVSAAVQAFEAAANLPADE